QIEWYRVHAKRRTVYLKRGKGQDGRISQQYPMSNFGRLTGWEKDLIHVYEPQFARLRTIQSHISHIRMRFRLISEEFDRNRHVAGHGESSDTPDKWT
ncbi:conjugative transfer protein MobI(A/C), partial [uncultured Thiocystis sp.]|uniref:conjugative transfer protein MobI(A/C) n=1 Tax=uncultured Thiocystis sp. TaxID=1202134 RepID=UPI0025EB7557